MLNWALYVLLPVCNIQVFVLHLSECFLTLPFRCLICDHIKVWQLPKSSFPNSSCCFPSQLLTLDPETPHLVKLNCYPLFPSAHSVLPACQNLQKCSHSPSAEVKKAFSSQRNRFPLSPIIVLTNNPHYKFSCKVLPHIFYSQWNTTGDLTALM